MLNTKNIFVRLILALLALLFIPAGVMVLRGAFGLSEPHLFVMLIFSGCLTFLVGLVGLVGLVASFASKGASCDQSSDD